MVAVVASAFVTTVEEARRRMDLAALQGADRIELRLDGWRPGEDLAAAVHAAPLPVIVACRLPRDGGSWSGSLEDRRLLLERAAAAGAFGIDLEDWEDWSPTPRASLELVIRSCHALEGMPKDLPALRDSLLARGAHVAKIAVALDDLADAGPLVDLLASTDQSERPTVAFGIGAAAAPTRVLSCLFGVPFVYASLGAGTETAPGQLGVGELLGIYDVKRLSGSTALYGVVGTHASHSLGPWLHNRAFRRFSSDAVYLPLETARLDALLAALPRRRLRGLSVTHPYKEVMAKRCHQLDHGATRLLAVNTVVFAAHGVMQGWNTDVAGVREALLRAGLSDEVRGTKAAVLGGGGAARAAVVALHDLGCKVTVQTRTVERIAPFCADLRVPVEALDAGRLQALRPMIVVHATPVGSLGTATVDERLVPEWRPEPGSFVLDMVYRPHLTRLLRDAREAGAVPVPGLEMFLAQAAEQIQAFTGKRPVVELLRYFLAGAVPHE